MAYSCINIERRAPYFTVWLFLSSLISGCSNHIPATTVIEKEYKEIIEKNYAKHETSSESVSQELLEKAIDGGLPESSQNQRLRSSPRFDISVDDVPAKTFFLSLVSDVGINVVTHPEVGGALSLELKNVTVEEVLQVARDIYGYEYKFKNGIYTIYPRKLRTEIFPINYIDVKRLGFTDTSVVIGEINSEEDSNGSNSSSNGDKKSNKNSSNDSEESSASGARVQTFNKTDFWPNLHKTLKAITGSPADGRMVMVNPQAGLVVVKALPREINAVRNFLERSELSVKRQVILETKILEVRLNEGFEAGINWGAINGQVQYTHNVVTSQAPADILDTSEDGPEIFASLLKIADIGDILSLLETQGSVQVLSSPRVSTVNNQKAVIRVGSDEFFVTGIKNSSTSNASSTTNTPEIELKSFFSGIALDVTPQIAENGDVILHIHPVISDVQDQFKNVIVGDEEFTLPLALRDIRESDSIVRARSGEIVVLGGLMQETVSDVRGKRPLLGDIPLVNTLFRTKNKAKVKTELVILMRPMVVEANTWEQDIMEGAERVRQLSQEYTR